MRVVTFRCPDYVIEELDRMSLMLGVDRTTLLRFAVAELIKRFSNGERLLKDTSWRVRHVKLSPPRDEVNDGAGVPPAPRRVTCEEVAEAKKVLSWAEIAERYGYGSKYTVRNWFKRKCEGRGG